MSARRRLRAGRASDPEDGRVPARLRRFRAGEWSDGGDGGEGDAWVRARRRWSDARRAWANAHGFTDAPYGTAPGSDWWAFLDLCGRVEDGMPVMSEQKHENPPQERQGAPQEPQDPQNQPQEPETFPRAVVEQLRKENAEARTKAKREPGEVDVPGRRARAQGPP